MYRGKFLRRNNLHLLSSVCLCGLFHAGVIYCSTVSSSLISHSSDWDVIFFPPLQMSGLGEIESVVPSHELLGGSSTFPATNCVYLFKKHTSLQGFNLPCLLCAEIVHSAEPGRREQKWLWRQTLLAFCFWFQLPPHHPDFPVTSIFASIFQKNHSFLPLVPKHRDAHIQHCSLI